MKYAEENRPTDYFDRVILSKEDSLGLMWLRKLKIIGILLILIFLGSCQKKYISETPREIVDYFNGIVLDEKA